MKSREIDDPVTRIRQMLLREHSKSQCLKIAGYISDDQQKFDALVRALLAGPYRVTQRAAWPLSVCIERFPVLAKPHFATFIDVLSRDTHVAVRRNVLRSLQFLKIPVRYHGKMVEICDVLLREQEPVAIQVFAMSIWAQIAEAHPDLQAELCSLLEEKLPFSSAGYRSRATKILRRFNRKVQPA